MGWARKPPGKAPVIVDPLLFGPKGRNSILDPVSYGPAVVQKFSGQSYGRRRRPNWTCPIALSTRPIDRIGVSNMERPVVSRNHGPFVETAQKPEKGVSKGVSKSELDFAVVPMGAGQGMTSEERGQAPEPMQAGRRGLPGARVSRQTRPRRVSEILSRREHRGIRGEGGRFWQSQTSTKKTRPRRRRTNLKRSRQLARMKARARRTVRTPRPVRRARKSTSKRHQWSPFPKTPQR
jgi:hypothetical protein